MTNITFIYHSPFSFKTLRYGLSLIFMLLTIAVPCQDDPFYNNENIQAPLIEMKNKLNGRDELDDVSRLTTMISIGAYYLNINLDSCLAYQKQVLDVFNSNQIPDAAAITKDYLAYTQFRRLEFSSSFQYLHEGRETLENLSPSEMSDFVLKFYDVTSRDVAYNIALAENYRFSGMVYRAVGNREIADDFFNKALEYYQKTGNKNRVAGILANMAQRLSKTDIERSKEILDDISNSVDSIRILGNVFNQYGQYFIKKSMLDSANIYFYKGLEINLKFKNIQAYSVSMNGIAEVALLKGNIEDAIALALESYELQSSEYYEQDVHFGQRSNALMIISQAYEAQGDQGKALEYYKLAQDEINEKNTKKQEAITAFHNSVIDQNIKTRNEIELQKERANSRRIYILSFGLGLLAIIGLLLFNNSRQKQKANNLLSLERDKLENTLSELKATQNQLIHSEKMASLGELTAGIAHEIQNPLNFVNNFSEVSNEILDEVDEELDNGEVNEARSIINELRENLGKITHHGQRASDIVKSMLEHSRAGSGEKVETNINALCDEYIRLAYHGMRAKDRSFNSELVTSFDESLPRIKVIPQDIGRVLLNLINNAFQACADRSVSAVSEATDLKGLADHKNKTSKEHPDSAGKSYTSNLAGLTPQALSGKVTVTTKNLGGNIQIIISDNGPGIPDDIKDKIFQPFFTTKPTGKGTGLGLSLSYDIIKAHGGSLQLNPSVKEGSEFTIIIPVV